MDDIWGKTNVQTGSTHKGAVSFLPIYRSRKMNILSFFFSKSWMYKPKFRISWAKKHCYHLPIGIWQIVPLRSAKELFWHSASFSFLHYIMADWLYKHQDVLNMVLDCYEDLFLNGLFSYFFKTENRILKWSVNFDWYECTLCFFCVCTK